LDGDVRLAVIALTEQALVFVTQAIRCGNLVNPRLTDAEAGSPKPRGMAGTQVEGDSKTRLGDALLTALRIEPRLLPRALGVVEAAADMLVGGLLSDLGGLGSAAAALLRQACGRCDAQKIIHSDATAADTEECREPAWRSMINAGLHPKCLSTLSSTLASAAPPAEARSLFTSLWNYASERSGRTVMTFALVELAVRHDAFSTLFLDTVTDLLTKRGDAAAGLTGAEISMLSLLFAAALCATVPAAGKVTTESAPGRRLVDRLRLFKTQRLDRFFQIQRERELASEAPDTTSATDALASPTPDVERPVRKSARPTEGSVLGSQVGMQPEARMSFQHLSDVLDALDWGGSKVFPGARKTIERMEPEVEGRPQAEVPKEEGALKRRRAPPVEVVESPESPEDETSEDTSEVESPESPEDETSEDLEEETDEEEEPVRPAKKASAKSKKGSKATEKQTGAKGKARGTKAKPTKEEEQASAEEVPKKRQRKATAKPTTVEAAAKKEQPSTEEAPKKRARGQAKVEKPSEEKNTDEAQVGGEEGTKKQSKKNKKQDKAAVKEEKPGTDANPAPKGRSRSKGAAKATPGEAAELPKAEGARKRTRKAEETAPEPEPAKKKPRSPLTTEPESEPAAKKKGRSPLLPASAKDTKKGRSPLLPVSENETVAAAPKGRRGKKTAA